MQIVEAHVKLVPHLSVGHHVLVGHKFFGVHVFQVPREGLAAQLVAQLLSMGQVANDGVAFQGWLVHEKKPLVGVHPHVRQSGRVNSVGVLVVGEGVRVEVAEYVAYSRTRHLKD